MKLNKFSDLLSHEHNWKIVFDDAVYTKETIAGYLSYNINQWKTAEIKFDSSRYIVCVGFNSLHYFIYLMIASLLKIKIIFSTPGQLSDLLTHYPNLQIQFVITSTKIQFNSVPLLYIDLTLPEKIEWPDLITGEYEQGKLVFSTSGTTGKPKLVEYTEKNLIKNAEIVGDYLGIVTHDICLSIFPVNYMYGFSMLVSCLIKNATIILERSTIPPLKIIEYLNSKEITVLPILRDVVEKIAPVIIANKYYFSRLRVLNAADKIHKKHVEQILQFAPVFWNNFGQTESGPRLFAVKITPDDDLDYYCYNDVVAIGYPVDSEIKVHLKDEVARSIEEKTFGELFYSTDYGMEGIISDTGQLISSEKFRSSGDLVVRKPDGLLFWIGRKSQTIKMNGHFVNINLLHTYFDNLKKIKSSFILYDDVKNQINGFFVASEKSDMRTLNNYIRFKFRKNFPNYPRLSSIVLLDKIPTKTNGKVNVNKLRCMI